MTFYAAHIHIERSPWNDDTGIGSPSEVITYEDIGPRESIIGLMSRIERTVGRKLDLRLVPDTTDEAEDNWTEDGWLYDIRVSFTRTEPCDMSEWLKPT